MTRLHPLSALWNRLPFVGRLFITASFALLVAGVAMILVSARQEASEARQDLRIALDTELEILPGSLAEVVVIGDYASLQQAMDRYIARPLASHLVYQDSNGFILQSVDQPLADDAPQWFLRWLELGDLRGSTEVTVGGHVYGKLTLKLTAQGLANRAWRRLLNHLGILLLAIVLDFIGIYFVLRGGLAPLKRIREAADAFASGQLSRLLSVEGSPELRDLIAAFNRMVQQVEESAAQLRESERRLAYVLESTTDGIWDWDIASGTVRHNAQWCRLLGLDDSFVEHPLEAFVGLIHPDDRARVQREIETSLAGNGTYESEHRMHRPDGSVIWLLDRGMVVERDAEGRPRRMTGSVNDITERKHIERMKDEFVSTVSHELRTPLTSISAALGLLRAGALGALPERVQDVVEIANRNSERLAFLINDLLDMEKIMAGKMHFDIGEHALLPLIDQSIEANRAYGAQYEVSYLRQADAPDCSVWVDAQRLQQVLSNFLSNAAKYSHRGDNVDVTVHVLADRARIAVRDHGPGIPESFRASLFQKFCQADATDTRHKSGTGLGLAISKELIERMGGRVGFETETGKGTTFYFDIPLARSDREPEIVSESVSESQPGPDVDRA